MISTVAPKPIDIMGIDIMPFDSYFAATRYIGQLVAERTKAFCVAINPEKIYKATQDPRLLAVLKKANICTCDGIGVALAVKILYGKNISRCTGCDLFFHLIEAAAQNGWGVFLLGGSTESNAGTALKLQETYPLLKIVGRRDGYFNGSDDVIREINSGAPDLLFVGMGSPMQEFWIDEHREAINATFCMGVGGTFDVISGKATRAPAIFRKTGTEFLFRLMSNPKRWRRQVTLPYFMMQILQKRVLEAGY